MLFRIALRVCEPENALSPVFGMFTGKCSVGLLLEGLPELEIGGGGGDGDKYPWN